MMEKYLTTKDRKMNDENRNYGTRSDQIHEFFKAKREWSKVKDKIVGSYIACYLKTVQHRAARLLLWTLFRVQDALETDRMDRH